jgi:hypothetical protein
MTVVLGAGVGVVAMRSNCLMGTGFPGGPR